VRSPLDSPRGYDRAFFAARGMMALPTVVTAELVDEIVVRAGAAMADVARAGSL